MGDLSRFLERNLRHFDLGAPDPALLINPPLFGDSDHRLKSNSHIFLQDYARYLQWSALTPNCAFGAFPGTLEPGIRRALLIMPREKALLRAWLSWMVTFMGPDTTLWLAGENRAGARSAGRLLKEWFQQVDVLDSARHCRLYAMSEPLEAIRFSADRLAETWSIALQGRRLPIVSFPGVFSHGKLDEGTRLLLEALETMTFQGRALDFGCGCGIIAAALGTLNTGLLLDLMDSNALALESSRLTLAASGVDGRVIASNGLSAIDSSYDLVISNPPFHRGHQTDSGMSMAMLKDIRNFMNQSGQLIMVVNRHLPYRRWLASMFGQCDVLAENNRYHVLRAR